MSANLQRVTLDSLPFPLFIQAIFGSWEGSAVELGCCLAEHVCWVIDPIGGSCLAEGAWPCAPRAAGSPGTGALHCQDSHTWGLKTQEWLGEAHPVTVGKVAWAEDPGFGWLEQIHLSYEIFLG